MGKPAHASHAQLLAARVVTTLAPPAPESARLVSQQQGAKGLAVAMFEEEDCGSGWQNEQRASLCSVLSVEVLRAVSAQREMLPQHLWQGGGWRAGGPLYCIALLCMTRCHPPLGPWQYCKNESATGDAAAELVMACRPVGILAKTESVSACAAVDLIAAAVSWVAEGSALTPVVQNGNIHIPAEQCSLWLITVRM